VLRKTTKTLNQDSWLPGQDLNRVPVNTSPERYRYTDQFGACFRTDASASEVAAHQLVHYLLIVCLFVSSLCQLDSGKL
jgi:hypothetical protein